MVTKNTKKKVTKETKKIVKREPSPAMLMKKVSSVSDTNKTLQKEIKVMSKIFGENQKVLVSMKGMIDTLVATLEQIQKQSKQINIIEEDTQKLYAGLNQVRTQSNLVSKINNQAAKLQEEITKISSIQKSSSASELSQKVDDSMNSIRNNSQMIIKIAQRIDEVRDDLRKVSGKTDSYLEISSEINQLKNTIEEISGKTTKLETRSQIIDSLKDELGRITDKITATTNLEDELMGIKVAIDTISSKSSTIDSLTGVIDGLKLQFETISAKVNSSENLSLESIKGLADKIDSIENKIGDLSQKAESTAHVGEGLKVVQDDISSFKKDVHDKTDIIEKKLVSVSETLEKQDVSTSEFHKKSEKLFEEIHNIKNITNKISNDSSNEMIAMLKLSEFQSNVRINAESKYGDVKILEKMARLTADIVNLFDKTSAEADGKFPLPQEIRQWSIGKILDCADRWEIRFSDVYSVLTNSLGRDMLKEDIRIQQIRDIYGIRAVDEIRKDLNIN